MISDLRRKACAEYFEGKVYENTTFNAGFDKGFAAALRVASELNSRTEVASLLGMDSNQVRQLKEFWMKHHTTPPERGEDEWVYSAKPVLK